MMRSQEVPTEEGCVCIPVSFKTMRRLAHLHCQHTALLCTVMHWQEQTWLLHKNGLLQRLLCTLQVASALGRLQGGSRFLGLGCS